MASFDQFREGLSRTWDSLQEGWHQLRDRATQALTRFNPIQPSGGLQTAEDQVAAGSSRWGLLAAEVRENTTEVLVRLEVPGMETEDFDISVIDGRTLSVRGEKKVEREHNDGRYHIMERAYGAFERLIPLPTEVDEEKTTASYKKGVLRIALPKAQNKARRRITIETH